MLTKVWRVTSGRNSLVSIENVDTLSIYKIFIYKRIQSDIAWKKKSLNIECLCDKFSDINSYSFSFISNYLSFKLFFNTFFIATRKKKGKLWRDWGRHKKERKIQYIPSKILRYYAYRSNICTFYLFIEEVGINNSRLNSNILYY